MSLIRQRIPCIALTQHHEARMSVGPMQACDDEWRGPWNAHAALPGLLQRMHAANLTSAHTACIVTYACIMCYLCCLNTSGCVSMHSTWHLAHAQRMWHQHMRICVSVHSTWHQHMLIRVSVHSTWHRHMRIRVTCTLGPNELCCGLSSNQISCREVQISIVATLAATLKAEGPGLSKLAG
eukprot:scaffold65738_cov23-Tisochrysis_lutea.AAC.3